jgi:hypothetical protein
MAVAIRHPDLGAASCASLEQFAAIYEPRGWVLELDRNGEPRRADANPRSHVTPTPITPEEVAAAETLTEIAADTGSDVGPRRKRSKTNDDGAAVTNTTPTTED